MADFGGSPIDLLNGGVMVRESLPGRAAALADLPVLTTQVMLSVAVPCLAGDPVAKIAFRSGATAAGTPTNYWFALYDPSGAFIAQSADQLTAAWAANTTKDLSLVANPTSTVATTFTLAATGVYFAAVMVKATTTPSLVGVSLFDATLSTGFVTGQKQLAQTSGSALTTTAPATIATPTASINRAYVVLH
jgi:hypothetical protein